MRIQGIIKQINPPFSGVSRNGNQFAKQGFIVEVTEDGNQFPMNLYIEGFGDEKIAQIQRCQLGQLYDLLITINSREYNGRYYTDLSLVQFVGQQTAAAPAPQRPLQYTKPSQPQYAPTAQPQYAPPAQPQQQIDFTQPQPNDGLPF